MAQINPDVYPTKYKISCADRDGSNVVEFSDDIAKLLIDGKLTFDTYMDGSNSYCGFEPGKYNYWVGGALFSVAEGDPNEPRSGNWYNYTTSANKINFRWCLKVTNSGTAAQGNMIQRWTPQKPPMTTIGTAYNIDQTARYDSLMTGNEVVCYYGNQYSTFYRMFPITNINIDRIQLDPTFYVIKAVPTYSENIITRYSVTSTGYKWQDIKPEDKTPAGANYNADLWSKGWYDEFDETTGNISARYILVNCAVAARYGTFKFNQLTAGAMNGIFGESLTVSRWNADEDRVLPSGINSPVGYLVPMAEVPFKVKDEEGVLFQTLSGIDFPGSGSISRSTNNPSSTVQYRYSDSAYGQYHYATVSGEGNTITHSTSARGGGFLLNWNLDDMDGSFTLVTNGIGTDIVRKVDASTIGVTQYYFNSDGTISRNTVHNKTSATVGLELTPFSLEALWATLASLGVWVITDIDSLTSDFELGVDFPTNVYRGEVLPDGTTTGRMFQGEDAEQQPWDVVDYTPVIPTPTPPGPEGEESGDRIPNNERYFSGAYNFITQYAMTRQQLGQFGNLLWTSWADQQGITDMWKNFKMFISADPASDTGSIDIASIMDFILSLQVFPFDLSSLLHTDSTNVCIGTGQYPLAVSGKKLLTINHILDCGTMAIPRPYNDFRDYENMSITAYLPYCGSVELNPGDVVGRSVRIEYSVDTLSGSCTAVLTAYDDDGYLYNVGMINGQISASIPMTATNSGQIRAQRISDVASLAGLAGNTFLGNISQGAQVASGADSNPIGAISSAVYGTVGRSLNAGLSAQQMFANRFSRGAISCPTLAGGNGIAAFFQPACPYIQMRYGLYQKPANYDHSVGEVSASSNPLSSYAGSGFTVCENVDISGFTCHEEERSAIKALLESGVYL